MSVNTYWSGSTSGSFISGSSTPFGIYDSDSEFRVDAPKTATWVAKRLGYPIINIELEKLIDRVQKLEFELEITENATDYIATQGFDPEYGARPLKRAIQKYVEDVLTEEIIQQNPEKMSKLLLDYNKEDDKMVVVITSPPKKKVTRKKKDAE